MRVIFTGQTGINRSKEILKNLALFALKTEGYPEDLNDDESRKYLTVYSLNEEIKNLGIDIISFLDSHNPTAKEDAWKKAFNNILSSIKDKKPKHAFLSMHHLFYRYSSFFSPVDWEDLIKDFQPDIFITLIDDIFSIWRRINVQDKTSPSGSYFRLREIASWRSAEILFTDFLAKCLPSSKSIKNYVVASKHPTKMLYRLLFEPEKLIIYAAFPITSTRKDSKKIEEINKFRMKLNEKFTVFDPITIDEDVLRIVLDKQIKRKKILLIRKEDRWPIPNNWSLCEDVNYPIKLHANEAREVVKDIRDHIKLRDFRLIDQADCYAGYRPHYEGNWSKGMLAEITYARDVALKRCLFVHFPDKDGGLKGSPFAGTGVDFDSVENLIKALQNLEKKKA